MQENNLFIIVTAPSGSGKTTIIEALITRDDRFAFVISNTSRDKRKGEVHGRDYYFIKPGEFEELIKNDEMLEWSIVHQNYYGISKKEFDRIRKGRKIPIFDVDVQGALKLKKKLGKAVYVFILPPSFEDLRERLTGRGTDSTEAIKVRLENAKNELKEVDNFDYVIVNDVVDRAVDDLKCVIRAEQCKDKGAARNLLKMLEEKFDSFLG